MDRPVNRQQVLHAAAGSVSGGSPQAEPSAVGGPRSTPQSRRGPGASGSYRLEPASTATGGAWIIQRYPPTSVKKSDAAFSFAQPRSPAASVGTSFGA